MKKKVTAKKKPSHINPSHYTMTLNGQPVEVVDIMEAWFAEDAHMAQAIKYFLRAGRKTDQAYTKDIGKGIWWAVRALMFNDVKHIELPPGAPVDRNV